MLLAFYAFPEAGRRDDRELRGSTEHTVSTGVTFPASGWTDTGLTRTWTVEAPGATILVTADTYALGDGNAEGCGLRILLDGSQIGVSSWQYVPAGNHATGATVHVAARAHVTAASHTVKAQSLGSGGDCYSGTGSNLAQMIVVEYAD
jgi:hypothetical protein